MLRSPSHLLVEEKNRHPYLRKDNPYCPRCRLRECPRWGSHVCRANQPMTAADERKIGYWVAHMLTNLDFYRVPPDIQIPVFASAFAHVVGRMVHPSKAIEKFDGMLPAMQRIVERELQLNPHTIVADIAARTRGKLRIRRTRHAHKEKDTTPAPRHLTVKRRKETAR